MKKKVSKFFLDEAHRRGMRGSVAVFHVDWDKAHTTVIDMTPSAEEETEYLLRIQVTPLNAGVPSVAYVYEAAKDTGHILVLYGVGTKDTADPFMTLFDVTRKKI